MSRDERLRILGYIWACRCPSGGFCFYMLDEPNAADTFYAIHALSLLGGRVDDPETAAFLQSLQAPDGSYASYAAALHAGWALSLLGASPLRDPAWFVSRGVPEITPDSRVTESFSLFEPLHTWVALFDLYQLGIPLEWRDRILEIVLGYENPEGGFGYPASTLLDTLHATEILLTLGHRKGGTGIIRFLHACEDPEFGFLARPGSRPPYLEHIHAGLRLSSRLGVVPSHAEACRAFLRRCAHHLGGFARSVHGGIRTLEFTACALESLAILDGWKAPARGPGAERSGDAATDPRE